MSVTACENCGTTERDVQHSEPLGISLCGKCFAERGEWVTTEDGRPRSAVSGANVEQVVERFSEWLYLPDPGVVYAVLGAIAANRLDGDPVWLLVVGPPSGGKSEVLGATGALDFVYPAGTLTEASLLSGTPGKDKAKTAKGGLLREIDDFGVVTLKDFGSHSRRRPTSS